MATFNKRKRLECVLHGALPDRPPITAYHHFPGRERKPEDLAGCMLAFQEKYDWDILKIHPAATVANEVWGNTYDYSTYENKIFPRLTSKKIRTVEDLGRFTAKSGDYGALGEMVEAVKLIKKGLKEDVPILQTLFTPINYICDALDAPTVRRHFPADRNDNVMFQLFREQPDRIKGALQGITDTFVDYVHRVMKAGADGFFYAEIGWARAGYMMKDEWETFVKPYDMQVIDTIHKEGGIVLFHTCGMKSNPEWFVDEPLDILHWDQGAEGNPPLEGSDKWLKGITPMGGVNEMLFGSGKAAQIRKETVDCLRRNRDLPYILAPYCSVDPDSSDEEFRAFRSSFDDL